ncbi:MAG: hypothetical protein P4L99_04760 [Chthoniobacter sp.]|nr:hypothetical protein [Chthoniobacter sp.]
MSRRTVDREEPSSLEWIESAVRLLRSAPPGALLCYYFGSATCLLGLLYFWADMSRGAFASGHLIESALNAALLYVWMKCWQAVFLSKLRAHLFMEPEAPWTVARVARLVLIQATFQPFGLFLRFIAANILIPYIWTYSLFMGIAILGDGTEPSLRVVLRGAVREAGLWWRQTHLALICLLGFAFFICLNVNFMCALLPQMLRMFLGIETVFTRDGWAMFNTTFFAATFAVTYLCFDPVRKAVFLVRHFHGQSLQSGEDLRVELRTLRDRSRLTMAALLIVATLLAGPMNALRAEDAPPAPAAPPAAQVDSSQLSSSLDRVLDRREYAWRFPRAEKPEAEEKGWLSGFFDSITKTFARWFKRVQGWMEKLMDWLKSLFESKVDKESKPPLNLDWSIIAKGTLVILAIAVVALLVVLFWRARKRQREIVTTEAILPVPDLSEESVTADQLPEDGWLHLARELMQKGELRLSLRAYYLASLAHLGQRELIRLERYKSNHDYDRELQRRARGNGTLLAAFDENLLVFERGWYGDHDVTPGTLVSFSHNIERMRTC